MFALEYFNENFLPILKPAAVVISALITIKLRRRDPLKSKSKEEKKLAFLSEYLAFDVAQRNPMVLEQAFRVALKQRLRAPEIISLMKFPSPLYAFSLYKSASRYVKFCNSTGELTFVKERYGSACYRSRLSWAFLIGYMVLFLLGGVTLYFGALAHTHSIGSDALWVSISVGAMLILYSIMMLDVSVSLDMVSKFLDEHRLVKEN